jgi:hypothetical protein
MSSILLGPIGPRAAGEGGARGLLERGFKQTETKKVDVHLQLILCCGLQINLGSTVKKSIIKNSSSSHTQIALLGPILKKVVWASFHVGLVLEPYCFPFTF